MEGEPPSKRIKNDFTNLINLNYETKFVKQDNINDKDMTSIRQTIEAAKSSSDISFGATKSEAKINWGKCLSLLIEDGQHSFMALSILMSKLNPGGGLL